MIDQYRILSPSEYKTLLQNIPKLDNRIKVETMLNTGMRYEELRQFGDHPQWFIAKDRCIVLPASATKTKRGRTVHLTPQFSEKLELYLGTKPMSFPRRSSMNPNLVRWWHPSVKYTPNDEISFCQEYYPAPKPKTFRKTWETWLIFAGYDSLKVAASQGHTQTVQISSYQNLIGNLKNEVDAVKELTRGWMT